MDPLVSSFNHFAAILVLNSSPVLLAALWGFSLARFSHERWHFFMGFFIFTGLIYTSIMLKNEWFDWHVVGVMFTVMWYLHYGEWDYTYCQPSVLPVVEPCRITWSKMQKLAFVLKLVTALTWLSLVLWTCMERVPDQTLKSVLASIVVLGMEERVTRWIKGRQKAVMNEKQS